MAFLASALMALSLYQAADLPQPAEGAPPEQRTSLFSKMRNLLPGKRDESAEADEPATPPTEVRVRGLRKWTNMFPGKTQQPLTGYHGDKIKHQTWSSGQWMIEVQRDGFADGTRCYLRTRQNLNKSRISYADGVLGFRFKHYVDANKVWFRVDDQPSKPWRTVFRDLHMKGLSVKPYASDYREDTIILIPAEELAGGQVITIRPSEDDKPEIFDIAGFDEAMAASKRVGCVEYVREDF